MKRAAPRARHPVPVTHTRHRTARLAAATASAVLACTLLAASPGAQAAAADCFDREKEPYTSKVDSHLHFRPFGGKPIPWEEMLGYLQKSGVEYANVYGIGQTLPYDSSCTYYLDCPGTPVTPSMRNDFANAASYAADPPPDDVHLTMSMTFPDLAHPEGVLDRMELLDENYPGLFRWMGEVNVIKQALLPNGHEAAGEKAIDGWAPFMRELRERDIPLTLHSDLGNNADPTKYLHLMEHVLERYPENKIVWAHAGLSKELTEIGPDEHLGILGRLLDKYPKLTLDISWRVLWDEYFSDPEIRGRYVDFLDRHPTRVIPGTDFVASGDKDFAVYEEELEVTSRINRDLSDEAFRGIALGGNYFRLTGLDEKAPPICESGQRP